MLALRPVIYATAKVVVGMAATMVVPMVVDWSEGNSNWHAFAIVSALTALVAGLIMTATRGHERSLTVEQAFLLTTALWSVCCVVGAIPFMVGAPHVGFTDAIFESMSGLTTTGTTAFPHLDALPPGANLWRAILHWLGGLGIVIVAMLFLPAMRVGGMQFFRSEGFDTMGKELPRAFDMAAELTWVYIAMTAACLVAFLISGMSPYDAVFHALSTCSTGGFSNHDASFGAHLRGAQYSACLFMIGASIPFIRLVQMVHGRPRALWRDPQVRAYLRWIGIAVVAIILWRWLNEGAPDGFEVLFRESLFNVISTFSGTGFGFGDVSAWGPFALGVLIVCGLIGGCTGSTGCSIKVFRFLVLKEAVRVQLQRMSSPHRILPLRYDGRPLEQDVLDSVVTFMTLFILCFGLLIVGLSLAGLAPRTALTAAWTSICNVGPVWGPGTSDNGAIDQFPGFAKWLLIAGMFLGRLELVSVLVLLLPRFWRSQVVAG
ncbi:TrkH family potassium uptake protein [Paracoccus suum]|uniref:Trk system potassium uptake protein n=1 Tax=Paracoccus suum TaxID=2259340 RepID=A0A344PG66_9RHOB|nr:TrkH family potassium uptake protein [Paracoccus suum]AXC48371.1 TrkH family potassium uptake protein [Paracoccus suum]